MSGEQASLAPVQWPVSGHRSGPGRTHVEVLEAESTPGGAARTLELTLPGFLHDFGSAVHPLGAGSPFFSSLPLRDHGLEWIHSPAALAHPLDDGTVVMLERDLADDQASLGVDGRHGANSSSPLFSGGANLLQRCFAHFLTFQASLADGAFWDERSALGEDGCRAVS